MTGPAEQSRTSSPITCGRLAHGAVVSIGSAAVSCDRMRRHDGAHRARLETGRVVEWSDDGLAVSWARSADEPIPGPDDWAQLASGSSAEDCAPAPAADDHWWPELAAGGRSNAPRGGKVQDVPRTHRDRVQGLARALLTIIVLLAVVCAPAVVVAVYRWALL